MYSSKIPSRLIVDASILFSFFKSDSVRRQLIEELLNKGCKLISPSFVIEELSNNNEGILKYSKIDSPTLLFLLCILQKSIETFSEDIYESFLKQANKLFPHGEDTKDDPYFALSLALNKTPIWSDEKAFKKQLEIEIFSTADLLSLFEIK
ncbi:MAG: PIN domain-containing protein [Nanoarchaeota archaeon]